MPHEVAARDVPGFDVLLGKLLLRHGSASNALDMHRVREAELLAMNDVRHFLAREHRRQMLDGHSRRETRARATTLTALLAASANYGLSRRKTFWWTTRWRPSFTTRASTSTGQT